MAARNARHRRLLPPTHDRLTPTTLQRWHLAATMALISTGAAALGAGVALYLAGP